MSSWTFACIKCLIGEPKFAKRDNLISRSRNSALSPLLSGPNYILTWTKKKWKTQSLSKKYGKQLLCVSYCLSHWPVKAKKWLMSDCIVLWPLISGQCGQKMKGNRAIISDLSTWTNPGSKDPESCWGLCPHYRYSPYCWLTSGFSSLFMGSAVHDWFWEAWISVM